jgi:hypothetical protein
MMHKYAFLAAIVPACPLATFASAGEITNLQLYDGTSGSPTAGISYTNSSGAGMNSA